MTGRTPLAALAVPLVAAALAARPDEPKPAPPRLANPVVYPEGVLGYVTVDLAAVWDHKAFAPAAAAPGSVEFAWAVRSLIGFAPAEVAQLTVAWDAPDRPLVVVTTRKPHDAAAAVDGLARDPNTQVKTLPGGVLHAPGAEFTYARRVDDKTLLLATAAADPKALAGRRLRDGSEQVEGHDVFAVVSPELAAGFGLPADSPLAGFEKAVNLAVDLGPEAATVRLTAVYDADEKRKAAAAALRAKLDGLAAWAKERAAKATERVGEDPSYPAPLLDWLATTLKAAKVPANGPAVEATATVKPEELVSRVLMAVPDAALAGRGSSANENNLKQIVLAFHNHHDSLGTMPANSYTKDGKPLLSWRVHILPYVEQDNLYRQFKLDEPWDSPHNKPLGEVVVKLYVVPGRPADALNKTYYRMFTSPKDVKPEYRAFLTDGQPKGPRLPADFPDGTSNTFAVVEAGDAVPWTKPDDLPYDGVKPLPRIGGPNGTFAAAMCDGSVRTFRRSKFDEANLRRAIQIADGEPIVFP